MAPGAYVGVCKPGMAERILRSKPFELTADGTAPQPDPQAVVAAGNYREYVKNEAAQLVARTDEFAAAIERGSVADAKALYARTRVHYERIEPIAEDFEDGALDVAIDGRPGPGDDRAAFERDPEFRGFHRLEYALWKRGGRITAEDRSVAERLKRDVRELRDLVQSHEMNVLGIASGARRLLVEIGQSKISGEEEWYSDTDLSNFLANIEGSEEAMRLLRPLFAPDDARLDARVSRAFADLRDVLDDYHDHDLWRSLDELKSSDARELTQTLDALGSLIEEVKIHLPPGGAAPSGAPAP